jgi:hypothetical protein
MFSKRRTKLQHISFDFRGSSQAYDIVVKSWEGVHQHLISQKNLVFSLEKCNISLLRVAAWTTLNVNKRSNQISVEKPVQSSWYISNSEDLIKCYIKHFSEDRSGLPPGTVVSLVAHNREIAVFIITFYYIPY